MTHPFGSYHHLSPLQRVGMPLELIPVNTLSMRVIAILSSQVTEKRKVVI